MTSRTVRVCAIATLIASTFTVSTIPAAAQSCDESPSQFCTHDDTILGRLENVEFVKVPGRPEVKDYLYSASCYIDNEVRTVEGCVNGIVPEPPEPCTTGEWAWPRWARLRDAGDGSAGPWNLEAGYTCPGDNEFPLTSLDFKQLTIEPSPVTFQPPTNWVYAGLDTIGYAEADTQGFEITLLGIPFQVAAVSVEYSWDFGDGSAPIVTDDPGKPYPNHTVGHTYTAEGTATPVLHTSWKGYFRTSEHNAWTAIPDYAQTVTTGPELTIYTARTRLVEDDLS